MLDRDIGPQMHHEAVLVILNEQFTQHLNPKLRPNADDQAEVSGDDGGFV